MLYILLASIYMSETRQFVRSLRKGKCDHTTKERPRNPENKSHQYLHHVTTTVEVAAR